LSETIGAMTQLRITNLLTNVQIDPEAHLDAARVERYAEILDALPPSSSSTPQRGCSSPMVTTA